MTAEKTNYEDVEGLDDGLDIEYDLSENDEGVEINDEGIDNNSSGENEEESEEQSEEKSLEQTEVEVSKKRKNNEISKTNKKQKMEQEKKEKKELSNEANDIIVEKISKQIKEIYPELSALELSEYYLNKSILMDTSEFSDIGEKNLNNLSKFIETYLKNLIPDLKEFKKLRNKIKKFETKRKFNKKFNKFVEIPKRKFILVLSISAIRACDIHRATRDLEGGSIKLIGKNPIGQDLKMLKTTWSRILNATPGRVDKILEISKQDEDRMNERKSNGIEDGKDKNDNKGGKGRGQSKFSDTIEYSLHADEIEAVILDNYVDPKLRSVLESKETFELLKKLKEANKDLKVYLY